MSIITTGIGSRAATWGVTSGPKRASHGLANDESGTAVTAHVLVVAGDVIVRNMLADYLSDSCMRVATIGSGREIAECMARETFDLVILDLHMSGDEGMRIVRDLREESGIPIIVVNGRIDEADRVMALELGADDYLTKPASPRELLARIRAILRRSRAQETKATKLTGVRSYRFARWSLNVPLRQLISPAGRKIELTNGDFNLLTAFLAAPQRVLTRDQLLSLSRLHNDESYERAIDVQVSRLRKKMGDNCAQSELIRTERGVGYAFDAPAEAIV